MNERSLFRRLLDEQPDTSHRTWRGIEARLGWRAGRRWRLPLGLAAAAALLLVGLVWRGAPKPAGAEAEDGMYLYVAVDRGERTEVLELIVEAQ